MMTQVHCDEAMIYLMQFSLVISRCNITCSVFWLSQGSVATLIRWGGWNSYIYVYRSFVNLTVKTALKSVDFLTRTTRVFVVMVLTETWLICRPYTLGYRESKNNAILSTVFIIWPVYIRRALHYIVKMLNRIQQLFYCESFVRQKFTRSWAFFTKLGSSNPSELQRWCLKTRVFSRDRLKTWFFMSRSWLSLDTCMSWVFTSRHVSWLVLTVSLSGTAKCLFCVETQAVLAERRPLGPFGRCLLTAKRLFLWLLLLLRL